MGCHLHSSVVQQTLTLETYLSQVADLGFMGTMARDANKKPVEGFDIYIGGRIGADSHLGDIIQSGVPATDLLPVVQNLMIEHFGAKRKA